MKRAIAITAAGALGVAALILASSVQVGATNVTVDVNLSVSPAVVSFETVFPGEVQFKPLNITLSQAFIDSPIHDDVEYRIVQKPKPRTDSAIERAYCEENPQDLTRCYPSLCPYLSKEPDGQPANDTGVPAFHDPNAPESIATGRLAKSDEDTSDPWTIDLHVPCFVGQCDQGNQIPAAYQLDPALNGQVFGCDLVVEVTNVSYFTLPTRTIGFWQTHTSFTSNVFANQLGGTMDVGAGGHIRTITNLPGNGQSRLFGAYYASQTRKTTGQSRTALDRARMQLLQQLVTAKINCAAFGCASSIQSLISGADAAYASGPASAITPFVGQLNTYNNSGDLIPIPGSLGPVGSATPTTSRNRANRAFWNSP
jgi:hypothetical protein